MQALLRKVATMGDLSPRLCSVVNNFYIIALGLDKNIIKRVIELKGRIDKSFFRQTV